MKSKFKVGDKVVFCSEKGHRSSPRYYPPVGTVGEIIESDSRPRIHLIEWAEGSTSEDDMWYCCENFMTQCDFRRNKAIMFFLRLISFGDTARAKTLYSKWEGINNG